MAAGRPKAFKSPDDLYSHFKAYVEWVNTNPILVQDYVGKDAEEVYRHKVRPLTIEGFENYCFEQGIINDLGDYFKNKDDAYSEFTPICTRIRKTIRQNQIEGGMAGIFNPSITQRLNSLVEKSETKSVGTTVIINKTEPNPINEPIKG